MLKIQAWITISKRFRTAYVKNCAPAHGQYTEKQVPLNSFLKILDATTVRYKNHSKITSRIHLLRRV